MPPMAFDRSLHECPSGFRRTLRSKIEPRKRRGKADFWVVLISLVQGPPRGRTELEGGRDGLSFEWGGSHLIPRKQWPTLGAHLSGIGLL